MSASAQSTRFSTFVELTKPSITGLSVFMAAGGYLLAGGQLGFPIVVAMGGIALVVAAANVLNMYLERDSDRLMKRTVSRPLPAGRMSPGVALAYGLVLCVGSLLFLGVYVNPVTAALGGAALVLYVLIYTPLKRRSPLALVVGAVPGAAPPLMGCTAATGDIQTSGGILFLILFLWQIPHFIAIGLYRSGEYERAGIRIVSLVRGERVARLHAIAYATALVPVSLSLCMVGSASWLYAAVALAIGLWFWSLTLKGMAQGSGPGWARKLFVSSLYYLPTLMVGLALDRMLL